MLIFLALASQPLPPHLTLLQPRYNSLGTFVSPSTIFLAPHNPFPPHPPSTPIQLPRHLRLPLYKPSPSRPPHQKQRYRRPQPPLQRHPFGTRIVLRTIAEEGADVAEAVRAVAWLSFDGGFDDAFDGELVGAGVAPFYEGRGDATAAVGGVHVEDREDCGWVLARVLGVREVWGKSVRMCGRAILWKRGRSQSSRSLLAKARGSPVEWELASILGYPVVAIGPSS